MKDERSHKSEPPASFLASLLTMRNSRSSYFVLFFVFLANIQAFAQLPKEPADTLAPVILEQLSKKLDAVKTVKAKARIITINKEKRDTMNVVYLRKGARYRLIAGENIIIRDSLKLYSYDAKKDAVNMENSESLCNDRVIFIRLLNGCYKGFKNKLIKEYKEDGVVFTEIDLYPTGSPKPYHTLKLFILRETNELVSITQVNKDGSKMILYIFEYEENLALPEELFTFEKKQ
jgi:outer membrane lipoprotein carrier protein